MKYIMCILPPPSDQRMPVVIEKLIEKLNEGWVIVSATASGDRVVYVLKINTGDYE